MTDLERGLIAYDTNGITGLYDSPIAWTTALIKAARQVAEADEVWWWCRRERKLFKGKWCTDEDCGYVTLLLPTEGEKP